MAQAKTWPMALRRPFAASGGPSFHRGWRERVFCPYPDLKGGGITWTDEVTELNRFLKF
jgi:hypothetical protein